MSTVRRVVAIATGTTCRVLQRRTVVRAARFVLSRARLDYPNDLSANGESSLQRQMLRFLQAAAQIHKAVVGANVGRWSASMIDTESKAGRETDLRLAGRISHLGAI